MKSKTIIISSQNKSNSGRGILTIYDEDDLLKCKLRLYGVEKLNRYAKIGIYHNNEVFTANLLDRGGFYESSLVGDFNMDGDFYSAIIKTDNNNEVLLAGGTYAGFYFNDTSVFDEKDNDKNCNNNYDEKSEFEETDYGFTNKNLDENDKCAHCKYKEYFYNSNTELFNEKFNNNDCIENLQNEDKLLENEKILQDNDKNELTNSQNNNTNAQNCANTQENTQILAEKQQEENKKSDTKPSILEQIVPQFKYVFENYSSNDELNRLIENGKFVSMSDGDYSLGAIYENDMIKYICYAVKCKYNTTPPEELGKHYQWLPLDREDPLSDGYYMVFQDAKDLKIIKM